MVSHVQRLLSWKPILIQLVAIFMIIGIVHYMNRRVCRFDGSLSTDQRLMKSSFYQKSSGGQKPAVALAPCPSRFPSKGVIRFNLTTEAREWTLDSVKAKNPQVKLGGSWKPRNCRSQHKLLVIISYRDRKTHLTVLMGHLHPLLRQQFLAYTVMVAEQRGDSPFNKGRLYNAAFREATASQQFDCVLFHDVDLIPENDRIPYSCPETPTHLSVGIDKFEYYLPYPMLVGGVFIMRSEHFVQVNGYSPHYWGWGAEDDDFAVRMYHMGLPVARPRRDIARYTMFRHAGRPWNQDIPKGHSRDDEMKASNGHESTTAVPDVAENATKGIGIVLVIFGGISIIINILWLCSSDPTISTTGFGIWSGALLIAAGTLAILSSVKTTHGLIMATLVVSIISMIVDVGVIVIGALQTADSQQALEWHHSHAKNGNHTTTNDAYISLSNAACYLVIGLITLAFLLVIAVLSCRRLTTAFNVPTSVINPAGS